MSDQAPVCCTAAGRGLHGEHEERRGETSGPSRIRQMGEKAPQRRQDDGRLSLLPVLTERKGGPSRFPCGWRQVANRSWLASGSVGRLASVHKVPGPRKFVPCRKEKPRPEAPTLRC